ncbi:hypothetical protein BKA62DRAFT_691335 [Auriculariales sp. MPI-PUGE-AT-0066]|nr:hypothetical protein BKA62DRAFT_691335 [Auriculariales sp. MPI-PUGE-AT-0066]
MCHLILCVVLFVASTLALPVALKGQCGGIGWDGPTDCEAGSECAPMHPHFWQCIPAGVLSEALSAASNPADKIQDSTITAWHAEHAQPAPGWNLDTWLPVQTVMKQAPWDDRSRASVPTQGF